MTSDHVFHQTISKWLQNHKHNTKDQQNGVVSSKATPKALLVWGPLQSGKKTILRYILKENGYVVVEPLSTDLDKQFDYHLFGKPAYILSMHEVGTKSMSHVKKSPVIYVTDNPYQHGLTKAQLESRFQMVNYRSLGTSFEERRGDEKDRNQNIWQIASTLESIIHQEKRQQKSMMDRKLNLIDQGDDFFVRVVHQSIYQTGNKNDILGGVQVATDSLSTGDILRFWTTPEYSSFYNVLIPFESTQLSSSQLLIQPAIHIRETNNNSLRNRLSRSSYEVPSILIEKQKPTTTSITRTKAKATHEETDNQKTNTPTIVKVVKKQSKKRKRE